MRSDFNNLFIDPVVVAVHAPHLEVAAAPYFAWLQETTQRLTQLSQLRRVASFADGRDAELRSADGHNTMLLLGLSATDNDARQQAVIAVRRALLTSTAPLQHEDPAAQLAVTGGPRQIWTSTSGVPRGAITPRNVRCL